MFLRGMIHVARMKLAWEKKPFWVTDVFHPLVKQYKFCLMWETRK